ncbi:esterase-like activity of phytase family protein [Maliponia aquimaris]|uniref:Phytase-like domain-containing protein n=1 Tax=Maliponia aquimaris TaxID=1673631 RepID=A0A238JML0_9RHOB|nr:esterase-like activity of phytase family protein [Maliponia aquimaris]SMX31910.1 hypothetical protein MAA8898_00080 [Maliponia aquimaris]
MIVCLKRLRAGLAACAAMVALGACAAEVAPRADFVGRIDWPRSAHHLGGFSGLEVSADGTAFVAISDRGGLVRGQLLRDGDTLVGVTQDPPLVLPDDLTRPKEGDWADVDVFPMDAEGLAMDADGRLYISFEGFHRVTAYDTALHAADLVRATAFDRMIGNSGFEALAIDPQGRLVTLPERSGRLTRPFPVWRYDRGSWTQPFSISRSGGFLPVGSDFGPDGLFYLLEREFTGFAFRTRIRRFDLGEDRVLSEETLLETPAHRHGNLEGIAAWRDSAGAIRLTLLSDDNFRGFQRSEFVEYRVAD